MNTRYWLRPGYWALRRAGLPGFVAWKLLRTRRAIRLRNHFRFRPAVSRFGLALASRRERYSNTRAAS